MKIFEQIIAKKIKQKIESTLNDAQNGFRKGRSIQDNIFIIKQIIEKAQKEKKQIYLGFIDLEKAFDRVPRKKIWEILRKRGVEPKIIRLVQIICSGNMNAIIHRNQKSETFTTKEGLRQGGGLSPILFIIFMDEIIKQCTKEATKLTVGYRNMKKVQISIGAFADDIVLVAGGMKELQDGFKKWKEVLENNTMKMNINKTKVMVVGTQEELNIQIENTRIEQVSAFQYLGVKIDSDGKNESEINTRIENTLKLYYSMNNTFINKKEISKKTKINVFKSVYRPVLTFGCESWKLTKSDKRKIQAVEMKYLRRVRGITRMDKIRNEEIRKNLGIESMSKFIEKRQLSWWGHLQRMDDTRPTKQI